MLLSLRLGAFLGATGGARFPNDTCVQSLGDGLRTKADVLEFYSSGLSLAAVKAFN